MPNTYLSTVVKLLAYSGGATVGWLHMIVNHAEKSHRWFDPSHRSGGWKTGGRCAHIEVLKASPLRRYSPIAQRQSRELLTLRPLVRSQVGERGLPKVEEFLEMCEKVLKHHGRL